MQELQGKSVLITGGTGSFGKAFVLYLLEKINLRRLIVFSRDELKQSEMQADGLNKQNHPCLRYFIGDVRDRDRLRRAFSGVEIVVHAAAMKQVPACEYNPDEAIKTNVLGALNVRDAALENPCVEKVVALSSDKGVAPLNLYGATKLCAEKVFIQGNVLAGVAGSPRFSIVRYGNVLASRGSVVLLFREQLKAGIITVTDRRMSRFWMTLRRAAEFVAQAVLEMEGGEIFVPILPSAKVVDLAEAIAPDAYVTVTGIRAGEKLAEMLITEEESRRAWRNKDTILISPILLEEPPAPSYRRLETGTYTSDGNPWQLDIPQIRSLLEHV